MLSEDTASGGGGGGVVFHSRVASLMAVLAQSAVAEISKLYDDGLLVLRLEVCRKDSEIEALKSQLERAEKELRLLKEAQSSQVPRLLPAPCQHRAGNAQHLYSLHLYHQGTRQEIISSSWTFTGSNHMYP